MRRAALLAALAGLVAVVAQRACERVTPPAPAGPVASSHASTASSCGDGRAMTVRFYDVGQALAVLIALPDGRHVLVDTGDEPHRPGCGEACASANAHLLSALRADLGGAPIDLLWLTHPHSDHIGGVPSVLDAFRVLQLVDDGRAGHKGEVRRARRAAEEHGVPVHVVEPGQTAVPLASSGDVRLAAIVPPVWPPACAHDANECSIGLRIDDCASSVLLLGDAEHEEEAALDPGGLVALLQVPHHGSETSTSPALLAKVKPRYAVVSAGKRDEGLNRDYCHPRALVVKRLSRVLGGGGGPALESFDGERCDRATPADWVAVPASDRLWATERDGDVVLTTTGDGVFRRVASP